VFAGYRYCSSRHFGGESFVAPEDLCAVAERRRVVYLGAKTRDMSDKRWKPRMLDVYKFPDIAEWIQVREGAKSVDLVCCAGSPGVFFLGEGL
jgi:hypothetical protein